MKNKLIKFLIQFSYKSLFFVISLAILIGIAIKSNLFHEIVKSYIQFQLKHKYSLPVTLGAVEGNLFNSIELKNIIVFSADQQEIVSIPKLNYEFNLYNFFLNKAILRNTKLTVNEATIFIKRFRDGKWNLSIFKNSFKTQKRLPINSDLANIKIKNLTINYQDNKGLSLKSIKDPFNVSLNQLYGNITIKNNNDIVGELFGRVKESDTQLTVNTVIDIHKKNYSIDAIFRNVNPTKLSSYFLPLKGYKVNAGNMNINVNIKNKPDYSLKYPFLFYIIVSVKEGELQVPFLKESIRNINGKVYINRGKVDQSLIKLYNPKITPSQLTKVIEQLKKNKLIDQRYAINSLKSKISNQEPWVVSLLKSPPLVLSFESLPARLMSQETQMSGELNVTQKYGEVKISHLEYKPIRINNMQLSYQIMTDNVLLNFQKGQINDGKISGIATIYHKQLPVKIEANTLVNNINLNLISETSKIPIRLTGNSNVSIKILGNKDNMQFEIATSSSNMYIYDQDIQHINTFLFYRPYQISFKSELYLNQQDQPLIVSGRRSSVNMLIKIDANNIPLQSIQSIDKKKQADFNAIFQLSWPYKIKNINIFESGQATGLVKIENLTIKDQFFSLLETEFEHSNGETIVKKLDIKGKKNNAIFLKGVFKKYPISAELAIDQFEINRIPFIQKYISNKIKPLEGIITTKILVKQITPNIMTRIIPNPWISNYAMEGYFDIQKLYLINQPFKSAAFKGSWDGKHLDIRKLLLNSQKTAVKLTGSVSLYKDIDVKIHKGSLVNIKEMNNLFSPLGLYEGDILLEGRIKQTITTPQISLSFNAKNIKFLSSKIDEIDSKIIFSKNNIKISPMTIRKNKSLMKLNGNIENSLFNKDKKNLSEINLDLAMNNINLKNIVDIASDIVDFKVSSQNFLVINEVQKEKKSPIFSSTISNQKVILYKGQKYSSEIIQFNKLNKKKKQSKNINRIFNNIEGTINGKTEFNYIQNMPLKINSDITVLNGLFGDLKFKYGSLKIKEKIKNHKFKVKVEEGTINSSQFQKIESQGELTKKGVLNISDISLNDSIQTHKTLLKGTIPLADLLENNNQSNPLLVNLNLVNDKINFL